MEIRWLEAFLAVAEELHFGRAAARLRMAQSPLSQTIRRLERELDVTLFDRSTRSVALTPAGEALLPHAHRVFEELELARQATRAVSGVFYGPVRIGFSGALDLAFVALPVDPSPLVRTRLISREPLGVALPLDHPLAGDPDVDLAELADDGYITTPATAGSGLQEAGLRACVDAGFRPRVVQEITDPYMILTLVAAGVGVALLSAEVAAIMPSGA